ncbi:MAG: hypothetical protein NC211_03780 [Alistipes senegalensis]|nr:hypothetical protein [Oxalobacter formigenes]MCM1280938.1 hypothetical protein [Alistipes senegalensis]
MKNLLKGAVENFIYIIVGAIIWAAGYATGYDNGVDAVINRFAGVEIVAQTEIPLPVQEARK